MKYCSTSMLVIKQSSSADTGCKLTQCLVITNSFIFKVTDNIFYTCIFLIFTVFNSAACIDNSQANKYMQFSVQICILVTVCC